MEWKARDLVGWLVLFLVWPIVTPIVALAYAAWWLTKMARALRGRLSRGLN